MSTQLTSVVRRNPIAILMLVFASVAVVWITEDSNQRAASLVQQLGAIAENRLHLYDLTKGVLDAESGQRGFLLSGREEYLIPYDDALKRIAVAFQFLDAAYSADPSAAARLTKLHELADTKLSELAITVRMQKEGKRQNGKDFMFSGIGREYMDAIRTAGDELLAIETARLNSRQREVSDILLFSRVGVALLSAISLMLVMLNMRHNLAFRAQERLQDVVTERTAQLVELNNHLQTARENERHRIARDLHDELGALLTAAKLDIAHVRTFVGGTANEATERLNHAVKTLNACIAMKQRIIEDLWPSALSDLGLVATLEILGREFSKHSGVQVHCELEPVELRPSTNLVIYRLVQEATTNIAKYAKASNVWIDLIAQDGFVEVSVRDDGTGFDVSQMTGNPHGLLGMRYRVEAELGTLDITSTPGQGTLIRARIPEAVVLPAG
jgi:signal transduction histidine kinase